MQIYQTPAVAVSGQTLGKAFLSQFRDKVIFVWRPCDFVVGELAVEHAEAIVMFCREDQVFHSGFFSDGDPLVRIEFDWIEFQIEAVVFGNRDLPRK